MANHRNLIQGVLTLCFAGVVVALVKHLVLPDLDTTNSRGFLFGAEAIALLLLFGSFVINEMMHMASTLGQGKRTNEPPRMRSILFVLSALGGSLLIIAAFLRVASE